MPQPVVRQPDALVLQRRRDAAAAIVAADDDVLDLQHIDRELHDRKAIEVRMDDDIGDVAVNEELARQQADDLVGRNAAVGAADPEIAGVLLPGEALEEVRLDVPDALGPGAVVLEEVREGAHRQVSRGILHSNGAFLHPEVSPGPRR